MAIAAHDFVNTSPTNVFATLNSIFSSSGTYTNGNLYINADDSDYHFSTISVPVGKIIYFEIIPISTTNREIVGFKTVGNNYTNGDYDIYYYNWENDDTRRISENGSYISSHLNNDITDKIVGLALDLTGTYINLKMYVNGSLLVNQNTTTTVNSRNNIFPYVRSASGAFTFYLNFGQDSSFGGNKTSGSANAQDANGIGDFYYSPPTDALALCTANLPDPSINPALDELPEDNFKAVTWTGDGSNPRDISIGFNPDFVWIKNRTGTANSHATFDSVRGFGKKHLWTDLTAGETANEFGHVSGVSNNNITVTAGTSDDTYVNNSGTTYVGWCFRAGGNSNTFNIDGIGYSSYDNLQSANSSLPASSTSGMITPSGMSIGTKQGFSIVKYVGAGTSNARTIPHGLSKTDLIIIKDLDGSNDWIIWFQGFGADSYLRLNTSAAKSTVSNAWGGSPNSNTFSVYQSGAHNTSGRDYIAYCWHSVAGYSAFGSYTGTNSAADGPFIYTGFKPAFVMIKGIQIDVNYPDYYSWIMFDNQRPEYNSSNTLPLYANQAKVEGQRGGSTVSFGEGVDFLSNGFKIRNVWGEINYTFTYIYMAFAEMPQKYAATNAR